MGPYGETGCTGRQPVLGELASEGCTGDRPGGDQVWVFSQPGLHVPVGEVRVDIDRQRWLRRQQGHIENDWDEYCQPPFPSRYNATAPARHYHESIEPEETARREGVRYQRRRELQPSSGIRTTLDEPLGEVHDHVQHTTPSAAEQQPPARQGRR